MSDRTLTEWVIAMGARGATVLRAHAVVPADSGVGTIQRKVADFDISLPDVGSEEEAEDRTDAAVQYLTELAAEVRRTVLEGEPDAIKARVEALQGAKVLQGYMLTLRNAPEPVLGAQHLDAASMMAGANVRMMDAATKLVDVLGRTLERMTDSQCEMLERQRTSEDERLEALELAMMGSVGAGEADAKDDTHDIAREAMDTLRTLAGQRAAPAGSMKDRLKGWATKNPKEARELMSDPEMLDFLSKLGGA